MPGHSTTDAIFIVRQLQKYFYAGIKTLYMAFVDLGRHLIVYPQLCHLVASSQARHWGVAGVTHKEPVGKWQKQSACLLQPEWRVKWVFTKALAWALYYKVWFWKPSPNSFLQGVPGKTFMQMTRSSSLNRWGNYTQHGLSGRSTWQEGTFGQHGQIRGPDIWAGARCASEVQQRPLCHHVSQGRPHKLHFLWWLFQLGPQEMQWHHSVENMH